MTGAISLLIRWPIVCRKLSTEPVSRCNVLVMTGSRKKNNIIYHSFTTMQAFKNESALFFSEKLLDPNMSDSMSHIHLQLVDCDLVAY